MEKNILVFSVIVIILSACTEKGIINSPDLESTQTSSDHITAENIFNDLEYIIEEGLSTNEKTSVCPFYNILGDTSLIIDYGDINCLDKGKQRRGKINIAYTGDYSDSLSVITATLDNYYISNKLVEGKIISTNQGRNSNGNIFFTINIDSAKISTSNGRIDWQSTKIKEWVGGQESTTIKDNTYKITGSAKGNAANGNDFTMLTIDTLNMDYSCMPYCLIKSGSFKISPNNYNERIISYGDNLCDCNYMVIIDGEEYPIVIEN